MNPIQPVDLNDYKGQALLTLIYDDGKKNNFTVALPLHAEFNICAGFAIIAGRTIDPQFEKGFMNSAEVTAAREAGAEICSHSYSHKRMTELNDADLDFELSESKKVLTQQAGEINTLCIPYSNYDDRVVAAAHKYYPMVRTHGEKYTELYPAGEQPLLHAFGLKNDTTFDHVKTLIDDAVQKKLWLTIMLHGVPDQTATPLNPYDIKASLLKEILTYVKSIGKEALLPVTFGDVQSLRQKKAAPAAKAVVL